MKANGWKLLHLGPTALFWTQICPTSTSPFWDKILNLGHYRPVDNITKEKPAKFQIKWTTGRKVLRLCNFGAPKRAQIESIWHFPVLQVDTPESWAQTKFEAKPVEISPFRTERTIGPKNAPCPLSDRNWKFGQCQSRDHPCQVSNPTDILSQSLGYFWSKKRRNALNPLCHAPHPEFYWGLL